MAFIIDKQTLNDLNIFGKNRSDSIYGIYNSTYTRGGSQILEEMFLSPLSDEVTINSRSAIISYFKEGNCDFPFQGSLFDAAGYYLENKDTRTYVNMEENKLQKKLQRWMNTDTEYQMIYKGVTSIIDILITLKDFFEKNDSGKSLTGYWREIESVYTIVHSEKLKWVEEVKNTRKISMDKIAVYDKILRSECHHDLLKILDFIYRLDVYMSIARTARKKNMAFATVIPTEENRISLHGLFHPQLKNPVSNDIEVDATSNVIFLTGANMAGKSTFMKSFGIAIFLAHLGFPVPATKMEFSVRNGMYTSINLPDNINQGYSHFYAEVLRLKKVAKHVNHYKNMVVIFDELFRGTNVKDAYDATVAITEAFAEIPNSVFVISTHIIESGEVLKQRCNNINYVYLPTVMDNHTPKYTYTLVSGITNDRHGMIIIKNEGILDILKNNRQ